MRKIFFLLALFAGALCAQDTTGHCSAPVTQTGQTVTITCPSPVTWGSLAAGSSGTLTPVDSTHATYAAPSHIEVNIWWKGCQAVPNDTVWSADISSLPVDSQWSTILTWMEAALSPTWSNWGPDYSFPGGSYGDQNTPVYNIKTGYGGFNLNLQLPARNSLARDAEGGTWSGPEANGSTDHHQIIAIYNTLTGLCGVTDIYGELTDGFINNNPPYGVNGLSNVASAAHYGFDSTIYNNANKTGQLTDAAAMPLALDVGTPEQIEASVNCNISTGVGCYLRHPLRFTGEVDMPGFNSTCGGRCYEWGAGGSTATKCSSLGNCMYNLNGGLHAALPYGGRLRLKASYTPTGSCTSGAGGSLIWALKHYGFVLSDIGSNTPTQNDESASQSPIAGAAWNCVHQVQLQNLELVDLTNLWNYQGANDAGFKDYEANPAYISQGTFAVATATRQSDGKALKIPIPLQGVVIGTAKTNIVALSGASSYTYNIQSDSWVTGTSNQSINWTMPTNACSGTSITSGGVLTVGVNGSTCAFTLLASAAADNSSTVTVYGTIVAGFSGSPSGWRMSSSSTSSVDTSGNTFIPRIQSVTWGGYTAGTNGNFYTGANAAQRKTGAYGGTGQYGRIILPNGNYTVRIIRNNGFGNCNYPTNPAYTDPFGFNNFNTGGDTSQVLEVNGQIAQPATSIAYTGGVCGTVADMIAPALVTNNTLYWKNLSWCPSYVSLNYTKTVVVNGTTYTVHPAGGLADSSAVEILPDSETPHWVIVPAPWHATLRAYNGMPDPYPVTTIPSGGSIQFRVGDYFTGYTDAQWSIANGGPGTISTTGPGTGDNGNAVIYTAPTATYAYQPVVIQATSQSHPQYTARYTVWIGSDKSTLAIR